MATDQELQDAADDALLTALQNPQREQSGTRVIEEHPLSDVLNARKQVSADTAASQPHFGLRFTKLVPPGCG